MKLDKRLRFQKAPTAGGDFVVTENVAFDSRHAYMQTVWISGSVRPMKSAHNPTACPAVRLAVVIVRGWTAGDFMLGLTYGPNELKETIS